MMTKFLLLLCFTAVHVLGDVQESVLSSKTDNLSTNVTSAQNVPQQHFAVNSSSKIISGEVVPVPVDLGENKTKPEEIAVSPSSVQSSTITPIHSTVIPPDTTTVLINMTETSTEQIPHVTNEPAVMQAPVNTAVVASSPGKWIINGTNKICIIAQMSAFFNVSYVNATKMPSFKTFNLPAGNRTVNVSGNCGETEQNLTLTWSDTNVTNASMTMHFMKNATEKHYSLHHLELTLQATDFPNRNQSLVLVNETKSYFEVGVSYAYKCLRQQKLDLKQNNTNETSGYVILWDLEFVAFKADNSAVFGLAQDCAFNTPDVVPIAVGCILSILVVFVLIAYTIGRRRNQNHGYRSM